MLAASDSDEEASNAPTRCGVWSPLRVDLSAVDSATAHRVVTAHRGLIRSIARSWLEQANRAFFVTTHEDLESLGEVVLLEAWTTYHAGDESKEKSPGANFRSWARRILHQRFRDYVHHLQKEVPASHLYRADASNGALKDRASVERTPLEMVHWEEVCAWMQGAIAQLEPRQRTILSAVVFDEESQASVAASLGISKAKVNRVLHDTLHELREKAQRDGIDALHTSIEDFEATGCRWRRSLLPEMLMEERDANGLT